MYILSYFYCLDNTCSEQCEKGGNFANWLCTKSWQGHWGISELSVGVRSDHILTGKGCPSSLVKYTKTPDMGWGHGRHHLPDRSKGYGLLGCILSSHFSCLAAGFQPCSDMETGEEMIPGSSAMTASVIVFCSSVTCTEVQFEGGYNTEELFSVAWCSIITVSQLGYTLDSWTTTRLKKWLVCWACVLELVDHNLPADQLWAEVPRGLCGHISYVILLSLTWKKIHDVSQNWGETGNMLEGRAVI